MQFVCWAPLPSGPVGPSWPLGQDRAVGFARIGYKNYETNPPGPVGTDVSFEQIQPVAEGPVGQYITHSPVGPDGMLSTCDSDQPMDEGPVGKYITRNPVGSDGMLSTCDSDQPVADGPVGPSGIVGPVDPEGCFPSVNRISQWLLAQWASYLQPCGMVSNHELHDPMADSPVGLTETPDPVDEMERPIQIDFMKIVQTDGPASLVDTPPSSDSGVHSWGEQWENMSISTRIQKQNRTEGRESVAQRGGVLVTPGSPKY